MLLAKGRDVHKRETSESQSQSPTESRQQNDVGPGGC